MLGSAREQPAPSVGFFPGRSEPGRFLGSFGTEALQQRRRWVARGETVMSEEDSVGGKYQVGIRTYAGK